MQPKPTKPCNASLRDHPSWPILARCLQPKGTEHSHERLHALVREGKAAWAANRHGRVEAARAEACATLRSMIKPGDSVYVTLKHVSRSGMYRRIAVLVSVGGEVANVSGLVAEAIGAKSTVGAVGVGGCGMDMGFKIVYDLGRVLFPDGGPLECSPRAGQERRAGETIERDGGYLLKHRWI